MSAPECVAAGPDRWAGVRSTMPRSRFFLPAALVALTFAVPPAGAQQDDRPLAVEMRGGVSLPVSSFRTGSDQRGEIERAPSFGLHFVYRSSGGWGPYIGFSQHRFECAPDGCPEIGRAHV